MKFTRRFTSPGKDPFQGVRYEKRTSVMRKGSADGSSVKLEVEVPEFWSQTATDILAQKYFRRKDIPVLTPEGKPVLDAEGKPLKAGETSVKQVVDRLAGCWKHWGDKMGFFDKKEDGQAFYDEISHMLLNQMAAPNSPSGSIPVSPGNTALPAAPRAIITSTRPMMRSSIPMTPIPGPSPMPASSKG